MRKKIVRKVTKKRGDRSFSLDATEKNPEGGSESPPAI